MTNEKLCAEAQQGNRAALDALVESNLRYLQHTAYSTANRYHRPELSDDLIQEGALGLIQAAELYEPERKTLFLTYAGYWVRKYMTAYLDGIIAEDTLSLEELQEAEGEIAADLLGNGFALSPETIAIQRENNREFYRALNTISRRESAYLWYRYGFPNEAENRSRKDTAVHFHLTETRARTLEEKALDNVWLELPWWYDSFTENAK